MCDNKMNSALDLVHKWGLPPPSHDVMQIKVQFINPLQ